MKTWVRSGWEETAFVADASFNPPKPMAVVYCVYILWILCRTFKLLCASSQDPEGFVFRGDTRPIQCSGCSYRQIFWVTGCGLRYIFFYPLLQ